LLEIHGIPTLAAAPEANSEIFLFLGVSCEKAPVPFPAVHATGRKVMSAQARSLSTCLDSRGNDFRLKK
jgi:hypothetical protein